MLLAVGLVLVTTLVVAVVAHAFVGLPWAVAFVLGAVVSPTDAVAASATARSVGLPRRLMTILEGESMVNDATGLVVYRFAVAAVVAGSFSLAQASLQFVLVSVGGLLVGLVVGLAHSRGCTATWMMPPSRSPSPCSPPLQPICWPKPSTSQECWP